MAAARGLPGLYRVYRRKFEGARAQRMGDTLEWLEAILSVGYREEGGTVVYERPFTRGMDATRCGWGIAGLIEAVAHRNGYAVVDIDPSSIKKWATGSGKADKPAMIVEAQKRGYPGDNEHEADAFLLLLYAEANLTED